MNNVFDSLNLVSEKVSQSRISAIKEMAMLSSKIDDVASLTWGLPSFRTPRYIRNAVVDQLDQDIDIGKYSLPDGLLEFRRLIAKKHFAETGVEVDADQNIMVTAGNMQGLNTLFHVIINPGDEVILTDPCFASHIQQILLAGGKPGYWPLDQDREWCLDLKKLPDLITDKTKAIVIVSPSNPTGKIFTESELLKISEIAMQHELLILIDDPYCYFTYENRDKYFNLASDKRAFEHIAYCFTFSKSYAMSGWRLGYIILPEQLKKQALKVHDATMICTPRISQVAGIAALNGEPEHLARFQEVLAGRRALICERLDRVAHVFQYSKPEGAYYVFPKIVTEHQNSHEFSLNLLYQAKVTVTPGSAFGPSGEGHVRMAYCVPEEAINLAFERIEEMYGTSNR